MGLAHKPPQFDIGKYTVRTFETNDSQGSGEQGSGGMKFTHTTWVPVSHSIILVGYFRDSSIGLWTNPQYIKGNIYGNIIDIIPQVIIKL